MRGSNKQPCFSKGLFPANHVREITTEYFEAAIDFASFERKELNLTKGDQVKAIRVVSELASLIELVSGKITLLSVLFQFTDGWWLVQLVSDSKRKVCASVRSCFLTESNALSVFRA